MIKNRPPASVVPPANARIIIEAKTRPIAVAAFTALLVGTFAVNLYRYYNAGYIYNTRKKFDFKSDPYSNTVSCTYRDVPHKTSGY